MKTLVLCRHAKSDWPSDMDDLDRPLKGRGEKDARRLGKLLHEHDFLPDLIVSSPANRALSTARIIAESTHYPSEIKVNRSVYFEGVGSLIRVIEGLPNDADTVLIFGHNPTMEQAVSFILKVDTPFAMPTSGMVCIESYITDWSRFQSQLPALRWIQVPRLARGEGDD